MNCLFCQIVKYVRWQEREHTAALRNTQQNLVKINVNNDQSHFKLLEQLDPLVEISQTVSTSLNV